MFKCDFCSNQFTRFSEKELLGYQGMVPCCPHCKAPLDDSHRFYILKNGEWVRY